MSASTFSWLAVLMPGAFLTFVSGCAEKEVKADFPRPPATATMTVPEDELEPAPPSPPVDPVPVDTEDPPSEPEEEPAPTPDEPRRRPHPARETPPPGEAEEPPSTSLVRPADIDPELASKLDRASSLLGSISRRNLTSEQSAQLVAARGFVSQARQALDEGDQRRAIVLIDKGLILAEDVERLSRR